MAHDANGFSFGSILEGDHNVVGSGLLTEKLDWVVIGSGCSIMRAEHLTGAVEDSYNRFALFVTDIEPVEVVAAQYDGLPVHGGLHTGGGSG